MPFDYLISARLLQGDSFVAKPGTVHFIKVPRGSALYDASHVIPVKTWVAEVQGLADGDENPNSISPTGDVLIFVHGFNNELKEVIARTDDLRTNLKGQGWHGMVVAFDWPSQNSILNYIEDRLTASQVALLLVNSCIRVLIAGQKANCLTNIHLIGHSTGAYVITEAFEQARKDGTLFKAEWRLGQVALIAADISVDSLGSKAASSQAMMPRINRLTNYSNGSDAVLAVSNAKRFGVSPRLGRKGLPADADPKAVNVDCTQHFNTVDAPTNPDMAYTHAWHFRDPRFGLDLAMTLEGAIDRLAIPTRDKTPYGLTMNENGQRPKSQAVWGIKIAAKMALGT